MLYPGCRTGWRASWWSPHPWAFVYRGPMGPSAVRAGDWRGGFGCRSGCVRTGCHPPANAAAAPPPIFRTVPGHGPFGVNMSELLLPVTERLLTPGGLGIDDLPGLLGEL